MRKLLGLAVLALVPAVAVRAGDEDKYTTVKGQFIWDKDKGAPPARMVIKPTKDEEVCAKDKDFKTEEWVISPKGGIKNVVVWLAPEPKAGGPKLKDLPPFDAKDFHPAMAKPAKADVEIDQPCCRFIPHIVLAQEGQGMVIKNSAPVPHNAKWTSQKNGEINPLIPSGAQFKLPDPLVADRFPITVECSIHPWMKAYVWVFKHPYFAVTDDEGNFEIKNVPVLDGKLRLVAWHEAGVAGDWRMGSPITVTPKSTDLKSIKLKTKE
ncbi:MAG TPA: hypothetical protein VHR66_01715 [Gemmataceae bacterium]|jgi:hypothetical protein|nr:hypothetical protein [Gemmataceae bacterium]